MYIHSLHYRLLDYVVEIRTDKTFCYQSFKPFVQYCKHLKKEREKEREMNDDRLNIFYSPTVTPAGSQTYEVSEFRMQIKPKYSV